MRCLPMQPCVLHSLSGLCERKRKGERREQSKMRDFNQNLTEVRTSKTAVRGYGWGTVWGNAEGCDGTQHIPPPCQRLAFTIMVPVLLRVHSRSSEPLTRRPIIITKSPHRPRRRPVRRPSPARQSQRANARALRCLRSPCRTGSLLESGP